MAWWSDDRSQNSAPVRSTSSNLPWSSSSISNLQKQTCNNKKQWHHHHTCCVPPVCCSQCVSDDECVIRFYLHTVIRFLLSTARIRAAAFLRAPLNPRFIDAMIVSFWCTAVYILTSFSLLMLWISLQLNDSHWSHGNWIRGWNGN